MGEISFFLDDLIRRAKEKNDDELLKKLYEKTFYDSLFESCSVFKKLGLEVVNTDEKYNFQKEINLKISQTLAREYFAIFYVNLITNKYVSYSINHDFINLDIQKSGDNFFEDIIYSITKIVPANDQDLISKSLSKENLINKTKNGKSITMTHRLILGDKERYIEVKALRIDENENSIVIGLSDVDNQKRAELEYKHKIEENNTYFNIALSLVKNYFTVYYVNVDNSSYIEYSINSNLQKLEYVASGTDFFGDSKRNALKYIVVEDQKKFQHYLEKDNLLDEINHGKVFTLTYQQLIDNVPTYVQLTAINLLNDSSHVILAVSNIDKQKKKDEEYIKKLEFEKRLARTDALTGVKNKYSYNEVVNELDAAIKADKKLEFAILICDINDLKLINDTLGHEAGDKIIKKATELLSSTFQNSNVYRVGGDEFAVILEGTDYYKLEHLVKNIVESNKKSEKIDDLVLAWGYSIFDKSEDDSVGDVFIEADENMYANKRYLKNLHKY